MVEPMIKHFRLNLTVLKEGICSYNNLESTAVSRRHTQPRATCLCREFPLSATYDEPEYRAALVAKGSTEIFGFLCEWGMMPTPLWVRYRIGKPSQLWEKISPVRNMLDTLLEVNVESFSFEPGNQTQIVTPFRLLRKSIGPVCASKVLHVLSPRLFVPWDTDIRKLYDLDDEDRDYLTFLETCKEQLDLVLAEIDGRSDSLRNMFYQGGWKPVTKLLDEVHWAKARGLSPHFERT